VPDLHPNIASQLAYRNTGDTLDAMFQIVEQAATPLLSTCTGLWAEQLAFPDSLSGTTEYT
jgi:hypothetical protein